MKAVSISRKQQLSVIETDMPKPDGTKVVIKVSATGICGSDLHMWVGGESGAGGDAVGLIMGHEFSGTVVDRGALKGTLKQGDRVTALPLNPCGECNPCKTGNINFCPNVWNESPGLSAPGSFAEYVSIRPDMVKQLPDTVSDIEGAMIEPASVAIHAVRLSGVKIGDKVLVIGGGIIGLLSAAWARIAGASYIALTEANKLRGENALNIGDVNEVFDAKDPDVLTKLVVASNGGFDIVIDCAATAPAVETALMAVIPGGKIIYVGVQIEPVPVPNMLIVVRQLQVLGSIGYTSAEFDACIDMIAKKKINLGPFVTSIIGFDDVQRAFERLTDGTSPDVKIILKP